MNRMNRMNYVEYMRHKIKAPATWSKKLSDVFFYAICAMTGTILLYINTKSSWGIGVSIVVSLTGILPYFLQKDAFLQKSYIGMISLVAFSYGLVGVNVLLLSVFGSYLPLICGGLVVALHILLTQLWLYANIKKNTFEKKQVKLVENKHLAGYALAGLCGFLVSYLLGAILSNSGIILFYSILSSFVIGWLLSIALMYLQVYVWAKKYM